MEGGREVMEEGKEVREGRKEGRSNEGGREGRKEGRKEGKPYTDLSTLKTYRGGVICDRQLCNF